MKRTTGAHSPTESGTKTPFRDTLYAITDRVVAENCADQFVAVYDYLCDPEFLNVSAERLPLNLLALMSIEG